MSPLRHLVLAATFLLAATSAWATNPPGGTCSSGKCGDNSSGTTTGSGYTPASNSLDWHVNVGLARYAKPASLSDFGQAAFEKNGNLPDFKELYGRYFSSSPLQQRQIILELSQPQLSSTTFHPSCLFLQSEAIFETLKKPAAGGFPEYIHQVLTDDAFTLVDVLPAPESGWRLRVWKRNAAPLVKSGAYYVTTNFVTKTPLTDITFKRPDGSSANDSLVYIQKETTGVSGTRTLTNEIVQILDGNGKPATVISKIFSGEGTGGSLLSQENLTYSERGTKAWDYTITREVLTSSVGAAGNIGALTLTAKTREDYDDFSTTTTGGELGMKRLMSRTEAYDVAGQSPQTTTNSYVQAPTNPTVHGRLQSTVKPDGSWTYSDYAISASSPVSIVTEYSGWKDLTMDQRANARKTVTTISANESLVESFVASQLISKSKTTLVTGSNETLTTSQQWDGSAWHVTTTGYFRDDAAAPSTGRIKWIENSDGTAATYSYAMVDGNLVTTACTGAGSRNGITAGTEVKTTFALGNIPIAKITKDITSGLNTEQWDTDLASGFDTMGRPVKRIYNADVNDYDIAQHACCGLEFSRDRMGAITEYSRDGLKRVYKVVTKASAASPAISDFTTVDGLSTTRTRSIGGESIFLDSTIRSLDGLNSIRTSPSRKSNFATDRPATTSVTAQSTTGDTVTTTQADGSTSITASYLDGQIKSVTGTAVPDAAYDYATHSENGGGLKSITNKSGMITSTFADLLGHTSRIVSTSTGTTAYTYHPLSASPGSRGKLATLTDGDGVTTSYGYDTEGERITSSRTIPLATGTATQVTTVESDVVASVTLHSNDLGVSHRKTQKVSSTGVAPVIVSESFIAIDGLSSGSRSFGRETLTTATRPDAAGIASATTTNPDGTQSVKTTTHGLITSSQNKATTGTVITGTSYTYDALQRSLTITDLRTGTTTFDVNADGQSDLTESGQPLAIKTAANEITLTEYDILGREIKTTLPDNTIKHTAYYPTGQVKVTWGSQTYPTWNVYDEQGRNIELHTWNTAPDLDPANIPANPPAGSETTSWIYSNISGHLIRKQYPGGKGTDYTYTAAGKLGTRTWGRSLVAHPMVTTYSYSHGFLITTDYSDTTPDVITSYDALGRKGTDTQTNQSQHTYTYDPTDLALDTETIRYDLDHDGTYEFTRVLDHSDDALGRDTGWQLKDGATIENQAQYQYSAADGRLSTIGGGTVSSSQSFSYLYAPSTSLIATITGPIHTVTNTWEPTRNVLESKQNKVGTDVISQYDYSVNAIGQRTGVATSGTAFPASPSWLWGYDSLGQVTSADSSVNTSDRAYQYDAIGNRLQGSAGVPPASTTYTANALNQYSSISDPQSTIHNPSYDDDGNMTSGPLPVALTTNSTLVWDGENRLISTTVNGTAITTLYDAQSRRIAETIGSTTTHYIYDGWNCIAEYQRSVGVPPALSKTRTWGLDLSGSLQGAGGVGGLLSEIHHPQSTIYYPSSDGNGNVSEYLASNGNITAHFEYDPFGNTVVNTDTGNQFAYRFSTKPLDFATGLYYYGYRWYDPLTGRWPSRDPIEEVGGINLYGFVGNDGVNGWDYLGQECLGSCLAVNAVSIKSIKIKDFKKTGDCKFIWNENFANTLISVQIAKIKKDYEGQGWKTISTCRGEGDEICACEWGEEKKADGEIEVGPFKDSIWWNHGKEESLDFVPGWKRCDISFKAVVNYQGSHMTGKCCKPKKAIPVE